MKERKKEERGHSEASFFREPITLLLGKTDTLRAEGAKKILVCNENKVSLRLRCGCLHVLGSALVCTTFTSGAVEVAGRIERICTERRDVREDPLP